MVYNTALLKEVEQIEKEALKMKVITFLKSFMY